MTTESQAPTIDPEMVEVAMSIIVDAGDARTAVGDCFTALAAADFDAFDAKMLQARQLLAKAHGRQTQIVQSEGEGRQRQHPLLFIHAQDTLMTVRSEMEICRQMREICQRYETRLARLEAGR